MRFARGLIPAEPMPGTTPTTGVCHFIPVNAGVVHSLVISTFLPIFYELETLFHQFLSGRMHAGRISVYYGGT